jgi:hypothetical protein
VKSTALLLLSGLALAGCGQSKNQATNAAAANNAQAAAGNSNASTAQNAAAPAGGAPAAGAAGSVTPDQFRAMMQRDGARQTVQALDRDTASTVLGQVYDGISAGNDQWLAIVPLLSTGTDASTSESLRDAMVDALPRNAAGVLRVLGDRQTSDILQEDVCRGPDQEPGPEVRTYLTNATRTVEAVNDPALQAMKTACLAKLREAQAG